jgi:CHAD domain-containing protein
VQALELKVDLSKSDVTRLGRELGRDLAIGLPGSKSERSVYFDTPAHHLHAAGLSLWLKRQDGHWLQTIEADRHTAEGISSPVQLESTVETRAPDIAKIADKKIRRSVRKAVRGTSLDPVFETVVRRKSRKIKSRSSKPELAIDVGLAEGEREASDAELELRARSAENLLLAAEKLLGDHEFKLSAGKAERADRLPDTGRAGAQPEKARPARIARRNTCEEAFSAILASAIRQIAVNRQAVLQTDDPEGAHQLRIGLRRLRSGLRALRPLVDGGSLRAFERSARDMGRSVGILRDADVLLTGIQAPIEQVAPDKAGFAELRDALGRNRQAKRNEVRRALRGPQWTRLELYLALWPRTLEERDELGKPITKHARRILRKAWRKVAKLGRKLGRLDGEHRHEMRKALKEVRYQAEFFAPLFKKRDTQHFIEQLKALQDVFGYINDARMAPRLVEVQHERRAGVNAARAASYTVGRHEAEAVHVWRSAAKLWKELTGSPRFWT